MARRVVEFASALLQGRVDGRLERGATGERALCQTVVLDRVPLRLNPVQLGAVRRQVIEGDPDRLELGQGGFDGLAVVDAIVVQRDGAGALPRPGVAGGHRRGEAALIQVEQVVLAPRGRLRQSAKAASSAWACAWR